MELLRCEHSEFTALLVWQCRSCCVQGLSGRKLNSKGLRCPSGTCIRLPILMQVPAIHDGSGEFHLGLKKAYDLWPKELVKSLGRNEIFSTSMYSYVSRSIGSKRSAKNSSKLSISRQLASCISASKNGIPRRFIRCCLPNMAPFSFFMSSFRAKSHPPTRSSVEISSCS